MKKNLILLLSFLVIAVLIAGCGGTKSPQGGGKDTILIKLGHDLPEDTPQHVAAVKFKEEVEKKTNGRVKVQIFSSNQLGSDRETTEMLQVGSVQAALIPTAKLSLFAPALQIPDLPFLFPSREVCYKFLDSEVGDELLAGLKEKGLVGVAFWESGFKQFTANKEIRTPDGFKGLKIRTMESPIIIEQYKALGANPVPINFSETYNALQQKVVDGQENPLVSIVNMRFYEVQTNVMISNHGYLGYAFLYSKRWFDTLPADIQSVLVAEAKAVADFQRKETVRREEAFIKRIQAHGTKVTVLTSDEIARFAEATRPVHKVFESQIGKDLMAKTYKKIDELSKQK